LSVNNFLRREQHTFCDFKSKLLMGTKNSLVDSDSAPVIVEPSDDFAGEFDVGDLVFANGDDEGGSSGAVENDVGGLQTGIAEEAVGVEVFVLHIFKGFFVRRDA